MPRRKTIIWWIIGTPFVLASLHKMHTDTVCRSIFFYLMDPHGQFVDAFGKNSTAEDVTTKVMQAVERWRVSGEKF